MNIDLNALAIIAGMVVSAIMEQLKVVQDPQTSDQRKMGLLALLSAIAAILLVVGKHLETAPDALLTWTDAYTGLSVFAVLIVSSQFYHAGVNQLLDAIVVKYKTTTVSSATTSSSSSTVTANAPGNLIPGITLAPPPGGTAMASSQASTPPVPPAESVAIGPAG